MIYLRTSEGYHQVRYQSFRDDLDPGWEARWVADPTVKAYQTMDEIDKAIQPDRLTTSDTWKLAAWAAKRVLSWEMTENMQFTGKEAAQRANDMEVARDNRFVSLQWQLVAAISEMERAGHLNVSHIEATLKAFTPPPSS